MTDLAQADDVLRWLLQPDNPSVAYLALLDLLDRPVTDPEVERARGAIMESRPVRSILDRFSAPGYRQRPDEELARSLPVLVMLLGELRADPGHPLMQEACALLLDRVQLENGAFLNRHPVYGGVRTCYQGLLTEALLRLSPAIDPRLERALGVAASMPYECAYNGGLPCAWGVIKLLRAAAAVAPARRDPAVGAAIDRGVEFLLGWDLMQADYPHSEAISPEWFRMGFPRGYQSDVLEVLDTLASLERVPDRRVEAAVEWVRGRQGPDGRWPSESTSPVAHELGVDRPGGPSKWVTLRARRVLKWWGAAPGPR